MTRAALSGGRVITYTIDGEGRRLSRFVDGVFNTGYMHDTSGRLVAEVEPSGQLRSHFVYATESHSPDYMITSGAKFYFAKDQLGSIRAVINADTGVIAQAIHYDEFGRVLADNNPGFQPFGFAGGHYDHETGLVRFGARDNDAEVGRWTARDPILFDGGDANLYRYVNGNPINFNDPSGTGPIAALACAGTLITLSTPAILDSISNSLQIQDLKSEKAKLNNTNGNCPQSSSQQRSTQIDIQIEQLQDQNKAADEYLKSLTDLRAICFSLITTPGP